MSHLGRKLLFIVFLACLLREYEVESFVQQFHDTGVLRSPQVMGKVQATDTEI